MQFDDDAARTHLETLLVQVSPKEVVTCKNNLSKETLRLLKVHAGSATMNVLESEAQFWSADETRRQLQSNSYFTASTSEDKEESGKAAAAEAAAAAWPEVLRQSLEHDELASAFGGLVSYFKSLLIDGHLLTQVRKGKALSARNAYIIPDSHLFPKTRAPSAATTRWSTAQL